MQKEGLARTPFLGDTPEERRIQAAQEHNLRLRVSTFPNDSHSWFLLGCVYRKQGKLMEAERALRKAVTLNPSPLVFWSELANVLEDLGHDKINPKHLQNLGSENPDILHPSEELMEKIRETKSNDGLQRSEAIPRITADTSSPCVSCPDYTYYGCRRQEACGKLIQWRARGA